MYEGLCVLVLKNLLILPNSNCYRIFQQKSTMTKKVFISYSWDNEKHKEWVRQLADKLISNGINAIIDVYEVQIGDSFTHFMEKHIDDSDYILVVLTPNYKTKSLERKGGVGYELQIISGEIINGTNRRKFLPILRNGSFDNSIPPHFKGISLIDFNKDNDFDTNLESLLRTILQQPKLEKPNLGTTPDFDKYTKKNNYSFNLSQLYELTDNRLRCLDQLINICDDIKNNKEFDLTYNIEFFTDLFSEYNLLNEKDNLTDIELERKINLKTLLSSKCYIYDIEKSKIMTCGIIFIISNYFFSENKLLNDYSDLYECISSYFKLFHRQITSPKDMKGFDIINDKLHYSFRIHIDKEELDNLLTIANSDNTLHLTKIFGLYVADFNLRTIINKVLPQVAFILALDSFNKNQFSKSKDDFLKILSWKIGIA